MSDQHLDHNDIDIEKTIHPSSPAEPEPKPESPQTAPKDLEYVDPFTFSTSKKWTITVLLALTTFTSTFCSSIFSATITVTAREFHVSEEITLLGVSLFVLGYALGPLLWGPLSELLGRKIPVFTAYFLFALLQIPTALSPTLAGVLICRLLAGCCGAAPVAVVSAIFADFWAPTERGVATSLYSAAVYVGPTLGPVIGSLITESHLGWRWTSWLILIMAGAIGIPAVIIVPETYAPVLKERAAKKQGLNVERKNPFEGFLRKYLSRPMMMLLHEPMVRTVRYPLHSIPLLSIHRQIKPWLTSTPSQLDIMTIYISLVYAIMYLTFFAFPYSYSLRGWSRTLSSLPFICMLLGILSSCLLVSFFSTRYYQPRLKARHGKVLPEDRLPLVMLGSVLLPVGLFWFAWTSSPHVSAIPQVISGFFIGSGIMLVFTNGLVYLVDIYGPMSASAVAANAFVRSACAAGLPLAAPRMYRTLGTQWATSLLAFLCLAMIPAPFVFYRFGARVRARSKYVPAGR